MLDKWSRLAIMYVLTNDSQSIQRTNDKESIERRRIKLFWQNNYVDDFIEKRNCDFKLNSASFKLTFLICFKICVTFITFSTSMNKNEFYQSLFVCLVCSISLLNCSCSSMYLYVSTNVFSFNVNVCRYVRSISS